MKKNRMMRLASILLVCVLLTTSVISGTFAKYVSEKTATSTATVARWSFKVGKKDIATENFAVDLFTTARELNVNGSVSDAEDEDVKKNGALIAPGTGGYFTLELKNDSQVTAEYVISISDVDDYGVPLQFSIDNVNWTNADNLDAIQVTDKLGIEADLATSAPIYWRWAFDDVANLKDDTTDTNLGITPVNPVVTVKVVATQVD